jgi:4-hydroxy-3-polyprenylbenzoate decarboxylase
MNLQMLFVCDEDIDVFDIKQVLHAFATKCHPQKGITYYDNQPATPLLPHLSYEDRELGRTTKVVYDCTWPLEWSPMRDIPVRGNFWDTYPERTIDKICNKWQSWGYPQDMKKIWEEGKERASWK